MKIALLLVAIVTCFTGRIHAQIYTNSFAGKFADNATEVRVDEKSKAIRYVKFGKQKAAKTGNYAFTLASALKFPKHYQLIQANVTNEGSNRKSIKYQIVINNIPAEFMVYNAHIVDNNIVSANGFYSITNNLTTTASISEETAFNEALKDVNARKYLWETQNHINYTKPQGLLVYVPLEDKISLAYKFDIYAMQPLSRQYIYVDAITGKILLKLNRLHIADITGTAITRYYGPCNISTESYSGAYRLRESGRGKGIITLNLNNTANKSMATDFTDVDNFWDSKNNNDDAAYDVHIGTEKTFDYYKNTFGRVSYDGDSSALISYVHYGNDYINAFWDGSSMNYGDGDGIQYGPLTSTDIVAHEITHGITEHTANLIYEGEAGALNESYSDIFGVLVDFYANPSKANFLMGDQIDLLYHRGMRNMANPKEFKNPGTYKGRFWDSIHNEVHVNSGVQNYWFYLLCQGGTGVNDKGIAYNVPGIGMDKAAAIAYRTLTVYLTPNSTYADACYYSIKAAEDLYGSCSNELKSVAKAWYAVGLENNYTSLLSAGFSVDRTFSCTAPFTVNFTNQSLNASDWQWDFGDGSISSQPNPAHIYQNNGKYSVSLKVKGTGNCPGSDSIVKADFILVNNLGNLLVPAEIPSILSPSAGKGIFNFEFGGIKNASDGSMEGYADFTCSFLANVKQSKSYSVKIVTSDKANENVRVWIDYDNNGTFSNSELAFESLNALQTHTGNILIPKNVTLNTPLRLRVASDAIAPEPAGTIQSGQAEDYTVLITANEEAPLADFKVPDTLVSKGAQVGFINLASNIVDNITWVFPGGTPSLSSEKDPRVSYNSSGLYDVTLIVKNSFGSDTITKKNYIQVLNSYTMGSEFVSAEESGILYDSGGAGDNYKNNESSDFKIQTLCAQGYTIFFDSLQIEGCCDRLTIYEGQDATGNLVYSSGAEIPDSVVVSSGKVFVKFVSDGSVNYAGYKLRWKAKVPPHVKPLANFDISPLNAPLLEPVKFTDNSTNSPVLWNWSFGDGGISNIQNPQHVYQTPGTRSITLIANNCFFSDTIARQITVQDSAIITTSLTELSASTSLCADNISLSLYVYNRGKGDLVFSLLADSMVKSGIKGNVISFDQEKTIVHPGDSVEVNTLILTNGLHSGNYTSSVHIKSNDPIHPEVIIPVYFTINGNPVLSVSPESIVYPDVFIGDSVQKIVSLQNIGCDTLVIASIHSGNASYYIQNIQNYLLPGYTDSLKIYFKPLNGGEISDTLKVTTNAGIALIQLSGKGLLPPAALVNNNPVTLETSSCGDSVNFKLTIKNTGAGLLKTKMSITGERIIFADHFENDINSSLWEAHGGVKIDSACGSGEGRKACYFNGDIYPRYLISKLLNTKYSSHIEFYIYSGDNTTCNAPEEGEELFFAYRKNNGEWKLIKTFDVTSYKTFEKITIAVPDSAKGKDVQFAWIQEFTSAGTFDVWAIDDVTIYGADKELYVTPGVLDIVSSTEDAYNITFRSAGLHAGIYKYHMDLQTNDPTKKNTVIPITIAVKGKPTLSLSNDSLLMCSLENTTCKRSFVITNTGCDTLKIFSISNKNSAFSVDKTHINILPFENAEVSISFTPNNSENYSDTLTFLSNTTPVMMSITGVGMGVPSLNLLPGNILLTPTLCNLNVQLPLTIKNEGDGILNYSISAGIKRDTVYVLALTAGVDYNQEYKNTIAALKSKFKKVKVTEFNTYDSTSFKYTLKSADVLLIADQENINNAQFLKLVPAMHEFVNNGGFIVFCGSDGAYISNSGFFAANDNVLVDWNEIISTDTTSIYSKGVMPEFYSQDATFGYSFTNTDKISPVTYYEYDILSYRNLGKGKVFYLGFDFYSYDDNTSKLLANIVKSAGTKLMPVNWLKITDSIGSLTKGISRSIEVAVNGALLKDTVTSCSLIVTTNCPMHDTIIIPVTVLVSNTPCVDFSAVTANCGGNVHFSGTASHTPDRWEWDFGDGYSSEGKAPAHNYSANGEYKVRLVITNEVKTDTLIKNIIVSNIIVPEIIVSDKRYTGDTIYFKEASGTASTHAWIFGDGNNSSLCSTSHVYSTPGKYRVICTIGNENGCSATDTLELTIDRSADVDQVVPVTVKLYPNPNHGNFSVDITGSASRTFDMEIFDNSGKLVERKNNVTTGTSGVSLKERSQGMYFIKIQSSSKYVFTGKMVVE